MAQNTALSTKGSENTPSLPQIDFVDKITLPGDKQYQRISLIYGSFWLPLPEWHSIIVVALNGTVQRKIQHKFIKQPKTVEGVLDEHVLIGCCTGLFCMSACDSEDCRIISDGNISDISVCKNYICAYEFKRKVILVFRRASSEWVPCEVVRPAKDVFQRLLMKDDVIYVEFENFKVCRYSRRSDLLQEFHIDLKGSRSPKNALRLCHVDTNKALLLVNWFKHTIDICHVPAINKAQSSKSGKSSCKEEDGVILEKLSMKLDEVKNPNDFVLCADDMYILAGTSIVHCKYVECWKNEER